MHFKADSLLRCAAVVAGVVASFAASALHYVRPEGPAPLVALPSVPRQFGGGHPLAWAVLSLPISQSVVLYLAVVFIFRVYTYETPFFHAETLGHFAVAIGLAVADAIDYTDPIFGSVGYGGFAMASLAVALSGWAVLVRGQKYDVNVVMSGKVVVVTGANCGIGFETACILAEMGATVVMGCRTKSKADVAMVEIKQRVADAKLVFVQLDVSNLDSIEAFVHELTRLKLGVNILINNAGVLMTRRRLNDRGVEMMMATNHLGPFLLTKMLLPKLLKNARSRVVNVTSSTHRIPDRIDFKEMLTSSDAKFATFDVYSRTKLCNVLIARELQHRYGAEGLDAFSVSPGTVVTEVTRDLGEAGGIMALCKSFWDKCGFVRLLFIKFGAAGAYTSIYAASDPTLVMAGGTYLMHCAKSGFATPLATDEALRRKLWEWSETHTDLTFR